MSLSLVLDLKNILRVGSHRRALLMCLLSATIIWFRCEYLHCPTFALELFGKVKRTPSIIYFYMKPDLFGTNAEVLK